MKLRSNRTAAWSLFGLALVAAGWLWWQHGATEDSPRAAQAGAAAAFVHSMQDTVPDGDLRALPGGQQAQLSNRLPYGELKRLFDYYLSAVGEQSIDAIRLEISSELQRRLPPNQLPGAGRLLALYLQFKLALVEQDKNPELAGAGVQTVRRRLLAMQDLRSQFFSAEETQGMFGFEDDYDMDAVARLEISQNPALTAAQKKEQLATLDATQSALLREEREAPRRVLRVEQMAQDLRAQGASDDDVYRLRSRELNPEAAARLAEVDHEEIAWKSRIATYLSERSKLLKAPGDASDSQHQDAALTQLRNSLFTADEQRRLPAYEQ